MLHLERILIAWNGTPGCRIALDRALALGARAGSRIDIVSVGVPEFPAADCFWVPSYDESVHLRERFDAHLREATSSLEAGLATASHLLFGTPEAEIVTLAATLGSDLIALGPSRHSGKRLLIVGSTAERVVQRSPVPCLLALDSLRFHRIVVTQSRLLAYARGLAGIMGGEAALMADPEGCDLLVCGKEEAPPLLRSSPVSVLVVP